MKKTLLALVLAQVLLTPVIAGIPLEQAIQKGIEISKDCRNRELETRNLEQSLQKARMKRLFSIAGGASYLYKSDQMEISFPDNQVAPGVVIPGMNITAGSRHNFDIKLGLSQPLYTGGILSGGIELEEIKLAMETNRLILGRLETAAAVKRSYFTCRMLQDRLASLDTLIRQLRLHKQQLQAYFEEELVRKSDLLETESGIQEQLLTRQDLKRALAEEKIHFKALCDLDIEEIDPGYAEQDRDYASAFLAFKEGHPVFKTLGERIALLTAREKMVKGQYLPQVHGFAEVHYGKPGIDFFADQWSFYFQGGISVALKLFNWNEKGRDIEMISHEREKLDNERADFTRQGAKSLKQLFTAKKSIQKKVSGISKLVRLAGEDLSLKEELLQEQQISNIDYLAALEKKEAYLSRESAYRWQVELIKVNINLITGVFEEEK